MQSRKLSNCYEASPLLIHIHDFPERLSALCSGTDGGETAAAYPGRIVRGMDDVPGLFFRGALARLPLRALDLIEIHPDATGDDPYPAVDGGAADAGRAHQAHPGGGELPSCSDGLPRADDSHRVALSGTLCDHALAECLVCEQLRGPLPLPAFCSLEPRFPAGPGQLSIALRAAPDHEPAVGVVELRLLALRRDLRRPPPGARPRIKPYRQPHQRSSGFCWPWAAA